MMVMDPHAVTLIPTKAALDALLVALPNVPVAVEIETWAGAVVALEVAWRRYAGRARLSPRDRRERLSAVADALRAGVEPRTVARALTARSPSEARA